jgi:NAD(P)-dependent dehydrogenase (short-subunit alcohol dehydrogenase family)
VLVTGGNGGIGFGIAEAVGAAGATVLIWGRQESKTADALGRLRSHGVDAHSDLDSIAGCFERSVELAGGRIDTVIANAGTPGQVIRFTDLPIDEWRSVMRLNLDSVMVLFQLAARHMIDAGGGALVAVSSLTALHGAAGNEAYGASKSALVGLTRALAVGLARHQIRVNALLPGWVATELTAVVHQNEALRAAKLERTPVRRWADPREIGAAAAFLADPRLTFHTGDELVVDGGYTKY